ncbi:MAG: hypothetical protein L0Z62_02405 [Gemmataceae bacterium]|nr:hypothetical protein [Gemmataceae bacterium]
MPPPQTLKPPRGHDYRVVQVCGTAQPTQTTAQLNILHDGLVREPTLALEEVPAEELRLVPVRDSPPRPQAVPPFNETIDETWTVEPVPETTSGTSRGFGKSRTHQSQRPRRQDHVRVDNQDDLLVKLSYRSSDLAPASSLWRDDDTRAACFRQRRRAVR